MVFKKHIGIDLGTHAIRVYLKGKGTVINEPAIVAYNNKTDRLIAEGAAAKKMLSRTPAHISAVHPVVNGVIADFNMAREMVRRFLKHPALGKSLLTRMVVGIPTNLTEVERKSVEDLLKESGASEVYFIEQPLAAAVGSYLDIHQPTAYVMVDIGAGTTDMAIISLNGIVVSERLKIAGEHLDREIVKGIREELKLDIGLPTAEEVKMSVGSAVPQSERLEIAVRGRDIATGLPKEVSVRETQVRSWIGRSLKSILNALKNLIETAPPELVGDVYKNGIFLCGGGSLLRGIDEMVKKDVGVSVRVVDEPLTCVVRGTGLVTEKFGEFEHLLESFS